MEGPALRQGNNRGERVESIDIDLWWYSGREACDEVGAQGFRRGSGLVGLGPSSLAFFRRFWRTRQSVKAVPPAKIAASSGQRRG